MALIFIIYFIQNTFFSQENRGNGSLFSKKKKKTLTREGVEGSPSHEVLYCPGGDLLHDKPKQWICAELVRLLQRGCLFPSSWKNQCLKTSWVPKSVLEKP